MSVGISEIDALRNSVIDCGDDLDPVPLEVSIGGVQVLYLLKTPKAAKSLVFWEGSP